MVEPQRAAEHAAEDSVPRPAGAGAELRFPRGGANAQPSPVPFPLAGLLALSADPPIGDGHLLIGARQNANPGRNESPFAAPQSGEVSRELVHLFLARPDEL